MLTSKMELFQQKTITISENKNRYHSAVTALEKRLKALKLYSGEIEVLKEKTPIFGPKLAEAIKKYEKKDNFCCKYRRK